MPALLTTRRFTVNDGSDTVVNPVNDGLKYRWQLQENTRFYRKKLTTKLKFRGDEFQFFYLIYNDTGDCNTPITLLIEVLCGGTWRDEYNGKIVVGQGDWDYDRCEVAFEVLPNDAYDCFNRALKTPLNWLSLVPSAIATPVNLKMLLGTIETTTCSYSGIEFGSPLGNVMFLKDCWSGGSFDTTSSNEPDPATAWRPVDQDQVYDPGGGTELTIDTIWARETISYPGGPPPGQGWINTTGDTWVRPVAYANIFTTGIYEYLSGSRYIFSASWATDDVDNGRMLGPLLEEALDQLGCDAVSNVVSDFLNISPPGTAPTGGAYDWAADYGQNIMLFQKSDVVNADASNNATKLEMTFEEMLVSLTNSMNLYWSLEPSGGDSYSLRIEHWLYYEAQNGLDLTTLEGGRYAAGYNQFKADSEVPNSEILNFQESFNDAFSKALIQYPIACSDSEQNKDYSLNSLSCDFGGLLNNPAAGLIGFVLVSTVDLGGNEYLIDNTNNLLNGGMSWVVIIPALWADGRYSTSATTTKGTFTDVTLRRFKEQTRIPFKYCCEETDFDPVQLINTGLGWGAIKDAEHDTKKDIMSVTLLQL